MLEFAARLSAMACDVRRVDWGRVEVRLGGSEGGIGRDRRMAKAVSAFFVSFPRHHRCRGVGGMEGRAAHLLKLFLFNLCERSL